MYITLKLDKRKLTKHGEYPIKVYISERRKTRLVTTGFFVREDLFDGVNCQMIGRVFNRMNEKLSMILRRSRAETADMTLEQAVNAVKRICGFDGVVGESFRHYWLKIAESPVHKESTRWTYRATLQKIEAYCNVDRLKLSDITPQWLRGFDEFLSQGLKQNSKWLYMGALQHVITTALDDNLLTVNPFKKIKVKKEETMKRSMSIDKLRRIRDMALPEEQAFARDMFMLSFYLIGMNLHDMYFAGKPVDGRLQYRRAKTGKLYDVRIEPEAQEIIDRYSDSEKMLNVHVKYKSVYSFRNAVYWFLKRAVPEITPYWARHTWATLAAELDVPMDTISMALGHSFGLSVTNIYVRHDIQKADAANRLVLDTLNRT